MRFQRRVQILTAVVGIVLCGVDKTSQAALVIVAPRMVAVQDVSLLGVNATLTAPGTVSFTFDVDGAMNSVPGGASTMDSVFHGRLPGEFAALGVNDAPFRLFSIDPETVTATGNGTHAQALTKFGLEVFGPVDAMGTIGIVASFYTIADSTFESDVVSLTDFSGALFQSPDRPNDFTDIYIGDNLLGALAGYSRGCQFQPHGDGSTRTVISVAVRVFRCCRVCRPFPYEATLVAERPHTRTPSKTGGRTVHNLRPLSKRMKVPAFGVGREAFRGLAANGRGCVA